jgi:multiple sugar transport system permease protein
MRRGVLKVSYHVVVVAACFLMLYPVLWLLLGSLKTNVEILALENYRLFPRSPSLQNYVTGWRGFGNTSFSTFFRNSVVVTGLATLGTVLSSAVVAYGFARIRFGGRRLWFALMLSTMLLPAEVLVIPRYILFQQLKWINTFRPLVVPSWFAIQGFFVFLTVQFMRTIPRELDESAMIDGASPYGIFRYVILPLASPALITTAVIGFYWKWNDFLEPLLYLSRPHLFTVSLALRAFIDASSTTDFGALFAMSTLSLVPVFVLFLFFNRYIVQGITTTGLKT